MARAALAAVALLVCASGALAALDCSGIAGCTACTYSASDRKGLELLCTACTGPAYTLRAKKGRCECADGFYSRVASGGQLNRCDAVPENSVAAAGKVNSNDNILRQCLENSSPDGSKARCLCDPGYFALYAGQAPRCAQCGPSSYTDAPNARVACKLCPMGRVHNAEHTTCVPMLDMLGETGARVTKGADVAVASARSAAADAAAALDSGVANVRTRISELTSGKGMPKLSAPKLPSLPQLPTLSAPKLPSLPKLDLSAPKLPHLPTLSAPKLDLGLSDFNVSESLADGKAALASTLGRVKAASANLTAPLEGLRRANFSSNFREGMKDAIDHIKDSTGIDLDALKFNGTVPPLKDVPGLENGASSARDALFKLAKGLAADKNVQDLFLKTIPANIKEALDTVNAISSQLPPAAK
ncbi:MAG: hypothetical protein J3K34DRAFT_434444 [Monoraphidium minutum]|nr:MAG: hypothetical protein J3K34DRAFT_434444 [Monoraphidium minutum]